MIEVAGLTKRFGSTVAVDDLSFGVEPGTITGFLGPNGAGKTTTLRALLGLVHPTAGEATIGGKRYRELDAPLRRVGAVLEATSFHPGRRARNHLRVVGARVGVPGERIDEVLELVGLRDAARGRVRTYSLGMRQRLSIAAALLTDPDVLILDEPANGLDPEGIRWLRDLLRWLASEGRTILVSSHVLAEVAQTVDRVVIIDRGRLVREAALEELVRGVSTRTRVRTSAPDQLLALLRDARIDAAVGGDGQLSVAAPPEEIGRIAAANGIVLAELAAETATLEDMFFELTRTQPEAGP